MPALELSLFRLRDFRALAAFVVFNSVGMMGENVVLGWLVLELTNSPLMVGVALGMRMLPLFFVGVPAGALADRWPRHRLLLATGAGQGVTAAALVKGFAVLGMVMRVGWLAGSLGAGAVIARLGTGPAYFVVAAGFLVGGLMLARASAPAPTVSTDPGPLWRSVADFFAAMRTDRTLVILMVLTAGGEILGFSHAVLLPSLARDVLQVGPEGLGVLNAARSVGGILGLVVASLRRPVEGAGALFLAVLLTFGMSLVGLAVAPHVVGFGGVVVMVTLVNSVGALASAFGVSVGFAVSGLALAVLALATAVLAPRARRL